MALLFRNHTDQVRTPVKLPVKVESAVETFSCNICKEGEWTSESDVEVHRKLFHKAAIMAKMKKNPDRFCTGCMRIKQNPESLLKHIKYEHLFSSQHAVCVERELFICDHCVKIFFHKDLLALHIQYYHPKVAGRKRAACPLCRKTYKIKGLWFHFLFHEIPSIPVCPICLTNSQSTALLMEHMKTHKQHFHCDTCRFAAKEPDAFYNHLREHQNKAVPHLKGNANLDSAVERCFVPRQDQNSINYNIRNVLKGLVIPNPVHICIICRHICINNEEMKQHIVSDHMSDSGMTDTSKKKHVCLCGETFFNAVLLKHHVFKLGETHRALRTDEEPALVHV